MIKTKLDNNVTNQIGLVYVEIETKLSGPIELGVVSYENQKRQRHDQFHKCDVRQ